MAEIVLLWQMRLDKIPNFLSVDGKLLEIYQS